MKQSINLRLIIIALIAIITTAVGVTLVYYSLFQMQVRDDLKQNAELLVGTEVFQNVYGHGKEKTEELEHLGSEKLRITWIDKNGTVLYDNDTDISRMQNHLDRPEVKQAMSDGEGESTRKSDTMDMNTYYYALLLDNGTVLRVATDARTITSVIMTALPVIIFIAAVILLACILIGHFLTRQLMKPIEEMAEDIDEINRISAYSELEPFAEKIRSQHEKMLAAVKSRQDFTANVSHELKTPITAISGYAELIENQLIEGDDVVHAAQQIRHNSDRLLSLVTDTIQLSEFDNSEISGSFETVDLLSVAEGCVEDLQPLAYKKAVTMSCYGYTVLINADRMLIREMIENLIQNSIQYNKENGSVQVSVSIKDECPVISVKDTGIGIPAEQQDRVFERFYRVDKSRSRQTGGTGLGLAIVKHIAELHDAEISMISTYEKGTEVVIRFDPSCRKDQEDISDRV